MAPERKHDEFNSFFERYIFRATFFSNWTSNFKFFLGTVPCFQVKHCYMKQIVVPRFDQQKRATDSSAWYSGYG